MFRPKVTASPMRDCNRTNDTDRKAGNRQGASARRKYASGGGVAAKSNHHQTGSSRTDAPPKANAFWILFIAVMMVLSSTAIVLSDIGEGDADGEETFDVGNLTYTVLDSSHVSVKMKSSIATMGAVAIPSTVSHGSNNYAVVEIADNGFKDNTNITSISVPTTLTKIGAHAFDGCSNLKSVADFTNIPLQGYTALEYIESTGTQYIDTGQHVKYGYTFWFKWSKDNFSTSEENKGYGVGNGLTLSISGGGRNINTMYVCANDYSYPGISYSQEGVIFTEEWKIDGSLKAVKTRVDTGETYGLTTSAISADYDSQCNMYLFKENSVSYQYPSSQKVYGCWMKDENDMLLFNLIPCERQSDQAIGMYDLVTNTFFENLGTGVFTAGPQVVGLESIITLSHVTEIGDYAFSGVSGMETVYLPEVESIGSHAFSGFTGIESITGTHQDLGLVLPDGYTQLEYIQSTGTQYIDSGISGAVGYRYVGKTLILSHTTTGAIVGCTDSSGLKRNFVVYVQNTEWLTGYSGTAYQYYGKFEDNVVYSFDVSNIAGKEHQMINGTDYPYNPTGSRGDFEQKNLYLFASNKGGSPGVFSSIRLYSLCIMDGNDTEVANFIPCISPSRDVGMYDTVTDTFFGNSGTGSFIAGPVVYSGTMYVPMVTSVGDYAFSGCTSLVKAKLDKVTSTGSHLFNGCTELKFIGLDSLVNVGAGTFMGSGVEVVSTDDQYKASEYNPTPSILPEGYTVLEYIRSTGSQAIDTGIVPTLGYWVEVVAIKQVGCSLFGSGNADFVLTGTVGRNYAYIGGGASLSFSDSIDNSLPHVWGIKNKRAYCDDQQTSESSNSTKPTCTIALFGRTTSKTSFAVDDCGSHTIYSAFIKDESGVLLFEGIPCRSPTGVVGMYDTVGKRFLTNSGSGSFVEGPAIGNMLPDKTTVYLPIAESIGDSAFEGCTGLAKADFRNVVSVGESAFKGCTKIPIINDDEIIFTGYDRIEYIESSGTQYIDTGIVPSRSSPRFVLTFMYTETGDFGTAGVQTNNNAGGMWVCGTFYSENRPIYCSTYTSGKTTAKLDVNMIHEVDLKFREHIKIDGEYIISGSYGAPNTSGTFYLFGINDLYDGSVYSKSKGMKLYSFRVYDDADACIMNLIPCIRTSDNAVGMYDTVSGRFLGNSGTGEFITGKRLDGISLPSVKTIGASAFEGDTGLKTVDLPDLQTIGASSFKGCTSLETVNLPTITEVPDHAFEGCVKLTDASLNKAISAGESAFEGCIAIAKVSDHLLLPEGYTHVESIYSDGSQYIDTEYVTSSSGYMASGIIKFDGKQKQWASVMGVFGAESNAAKFGLDSSGTKWEATFGNSKTSTATLQPNTDIAFEVSFISGEKYLRVDGTDVLSTDNAASIYSASIYLFGHNRSNAFFKQESMAGWLYEVKLYDSSKTLVRDLVPCICDSDSKVGMYDLVTEQFYGGKGEGSLIAGPIIGVGVYLPLLQTMGDRAFAGCQSLEAVSLSKVKAISEGAFNGDSELVTVGMPKVTVVDSSVFAGCKKLESVVFSSESCSLGNNSFAGAGVDGDGLRLAAKVSMLYSGVFTGTNIKAIAEDESSLADGTISMHGLTSLPMYTFENLKYISIFQSKSLTNVGESAFHNAKALTTVSIPAVTSVGKTAFANDTKLDRVTLGQTTNLLEGVFKGSGAAGFKVTGNIVSVGKDAFRDSKIQYIETDTSDPNHDIDLTYATSVQNGAFYGTPIRSIAMPALTSLGSDAFYQCEDLEKVTIGTGFKGEISPNAFRDCSTLAEIHAVNVTTIGKYAFYGCGLLTTAEFGSLVGDTYTSSCTKVEEYAFYECTKFDAKYVAKNLKTISNFAFSNTGITEYISTVENATIGSGAFARCSALKTVESNAVTVGVNAFDMTGSGTALNSVKMEYLVTMGVEAFKNCTALGLVNIGTKGTSVSGSDPVYLTEIPANAFYGCVMLYTVNIPHVEKIGSYAFYQCPISTFGSVANIDDIESNIISLPYVTAIGDHAFFGAWNMKDVVAGSLTSLGASSFEGCTSLNTFRADSIGTIGDRAFFGCSSLYHVADTKAISSSELSAYLTKVASIGSDIMSGSLIENIYIGFVYTLSASAFNNMAALKETVIQGSINSLPDNTFSGCAALTNVYLPATITYIGKDAFSGTSGNVVVLCNGSVKPTGTTTGFVLKGTFTDSSIKWGYVIDMVGVNTASYRIIDGSKYILPYADNDETADVVLYLKNGKTEAELNAGKSGSVIEIHMYKTGEQMTFRADNIAIGGFTVKATFSDLSAFEGGVEPTLNVTEYAQEFILPVPKTEGELKDENFTKYVGFDSSVTFGNDTDPITQPFTVRMTFYESKFELFSNKSSYDLIQHYNVPPITSEMTGMPDTKTTTYVAGTETEYLDPAPEVAGYTYKGWYYDQLGTPGQEVVGNVVTMNKTQHIYAIYEPKVVTVQFKLGDVVLATAESEQYVTLQVYNRGDPMAGRIVVSGIEGPDYPKYVYYSEEEYLRYFTPSVIGDGQDLRLYIINSRPYAESDQPGSVMIEKLYDNTVVEVQVQNRLYDIKVESYGVQCEAPALSDVKVSGNSVESGYWLKDLIYVQLDGISFPIQEVTAKGAAFHHAELYRGETKLGSYGNIQGYTQSDIPIDSNTFGSYKSLTIKLYFEKAKYTLRYNVPTDFLGTYKADNSKSIGPAEDITPILPTPMGQSIAGYNFEGWYFNNHLLAKGDAAYLGTTGYLTEEMKAYGDIPENTMIIDVYAKFTEKSYLVRYSYQSEDMEGKTQTYSRYAQTMGEGGVSQYTLVTIGKNIPFIVDDGQMPTSMTDLVRENKTLTGWYYSGTQPYITKLITAKVTPELLISATSEFQGYNVIVLTAVWEDKTYTIEFYPGYYDQEMVSHTQTAKVGETFTVPSSKALKKEYHVFGYWYLGSTDTRFADGDVVKLTKEHTVFADDEDKITVEVFWKYDTYNIVYDSSIYQDAHGEVPPGTNSIQIGTKFTVAGTENPDTGEPWLTRTGFTLVGWNYSKNPTVDPPKSPLTSYETMTEAMAATASTTDHNVHLYPVWSAQKYTIEYELGEGGKSGAYSPNLGTYGSDVMISAPTKYGFTFAGWSADPATISAENAVYSQGGNYVSWDGSPTKATVFKNLSTSTTVPVKMTANWTRAEYTIKYNTSGAIGAYSGGTQLVCKVGEDLKLAELGDMTYIGRHFVGWTVNGVQVIGGSGEIITVDDTMAGHADENDEITIYALWEFNSYVIEYHSTETSSSSVSTYYGTSVNIGVPVKDGYTFTGWKADNLGTTAMYSNDGNSWMPWPDTSVTPVGKHVINLLDDTGTVKLEAQWVKTPYTITYNPNGAEGDVPEDTTSCTIGDPITLRGSGNLTKAGYTFIGWSLDKVNLIKSNVFTSAMAEKADAYKFVTVYAMWAPGTYTIQITEDETGAYREISAYYDTSVPLGIPEREGYTFLGWSSTDVSIGNAMYSRNDSSWFTWMNISDVIYAGYFKNLSGTVGGIVHMDANWISIEYTVRYDANGGKGTVPEDTNSYKVGDPFALPSIADTKLTNGNKKLVGWALERDDLYALETDTFENRFVDYADSNNTVTFYAVWAEGSYTVTVDIGNSAASAIPYGWTDIGGGKYTKPAEYGESVKEIMSEWENVTLSLDGYKFVTWNMERTKVVSDVTVTAVFEAISPSMIYYLIGAIGGIVLVVIVITRHERA